MTITALPTAPTRADAANFRTRADAFLSALPTFGTQANALAADVIVRQADVTTKHNSVVAAQAAAMAAGLANAATNASTATTKAAEAAASANSAQAAWTAALAANPDLNPVIRMNPSVVSENVTIPSHYNAYSAGPLEIADGATVTLDDHSNWSIL